MHPEHNPERRAERAKRLQKRYDQAADVTYVDAAEYPNQNAMAVVAVAGSQYRLAAAASIFTTQPEVGEETAIALAYAATNAHCIISDSKTAIRNYTRGLIAPQAQKILSGTPPSRQRRVQIIWAPGHSGLAGNEAAHDAARALAHRRIILLLRLPIPTSLCSASRSRAGPNGHVERNSPSLPQGAVTLPPAHKTLNKSQSTTWRLLQTRTFPNPVLYNRMYPDAYSPLCKACEARADLDHIIWQCPKPHPPTPPTLTHA